MYCVSYKFTLLADSLENRRKFIACWGGVSAFFEAECGALGARLHGGTGGVFYGYAQWPSKAAYDAASEFTPTEDFMKHRMVWAELCAPSEVVFEGRVIADRMNAADKTP